MLPTALTAVSVCTLDQKALKVLESKTADGVREVAWCDEPLPTVCVGSSDVLVRVSHAALNRRDHWIRRDLYPGVSFPAVLGADACGVVEGVGTESDRGLLGQRVVINAAVGACTGRSR